MKHLYVIESVNRKDGYRTGAALHVNAETLGDALVVADRADQADQCQGWEVERLRVLRGDRPDGVVVWSR